MFFNRKCLAAFAALFVATPALADPLLIVTGPKAGTYIAFGRDIANVAKQNNIAMEVKPSDGSIDNIKHLNGKGASLGIVQSDVLSFLARARNPDTFKMGEHLRMILPLYHEEVHVLARSSIKRFEDLNGKRVVVGEDGSGHMLTAINLLAMMNVTPGELIKKPPAEGVLAVTDGQADAVIYVGGKPVRMFKNLENLAREGGSRYADTLSQVHFVPLADPRMLEEYDTAEITSADYEYVKTPVPTIAVRAVLVAYDFSAKGANDSARCRQVGALTQALGKNLENLKKQGHPKWAEVSFNAKLPIWKKDDCAWDTANAVGKEPAKPEKKKAKKQPPKKQKTAPKRNGTIPLR